MRVVLGSAFRNMEGRTDRYFTQATDLRRHLQHDYPGSTLRLVAVEGDSRDHTRKALVKGANSRNLHLDLLTHNHGHPPFGSTERPERLAALTDILHVGLSAIYQEDDVLIWIESDLIWTPPNLLGLIRTACATAAVCAPMVWAGGAFYDIWGFRGLDNQRFSPFPPFHPDYNPDRLTELSSAGSCLVMPGDIATKVRAEGREALVSWCRSARQQGHRILLAPDFEVRHPA